MDAFGVFYPAVSLTKGKRFKYEPEIVMLKTNLIYEKQPLIIDGGLSNVLENKGFDLNHKLWTARLLEENPSAIIEAHLAYIQSGAHCITTASYQASILGLVDLGYTEDAARKLIEKSVQLTELAIEEAFKAGLINTKPLIAASVGPYGAYLADGSEYRGDYGVANQVLYDFHVERIKILDQSTADILACETIPSFQEASVLSEILAKMETPAWISFSCRDEHHLNDGSTLEQCVSLFKDHPKVVAVGVNCTHPKYISAIIKRIKSLSINKKIIVYPNSGEAYHAESKTWLGLSSPYSFATMAIEWRRLGADIIGGCCRLGPVQIKEMSELMKRPENDN